MNTYTTLDSTKSAKQDVAVLAIDREATPERKGMSDQQKKWIEPLGPMQTILQFLVYSLIKLFIKVLFRYKTIGLENVPNNGQVIFIPNHASYIDAFLLAASLPYHQLRNLQWAGYKSIAFGNVLTRFFSRLVQGIPIDPERVFSSLSLAAAVLKRRRSLVWFPEGTCTRSSELQEFKGGIGVLLERFPDALVVPVFLKNTGKALAPGSWRIHPVKLEVIFGEAQMASDLRRAGRGNTEREQILSALYTAVKRLDKAV